MPLPLQCRIARYWCTQEGAGQACSVPRAVCIQPLHVRTTQVPLGRNSFLKKKISKDREALQPQPVVLS